MADDKRKQDSDDEMVEIEVDDLPDETKAVPKAGTDGVIEITLDDLEDVPDEGMAATPSAGKVYPGVDAAMVKQATAGEEIRMYVTCSETGQGFYVCWHEISPQVYGVSRVEKAAHEEAGAGAGPTAIQGTFSLADFCGCPYCGCRRMSVCEVCGATMCEAATKTTWLGRATLKCPRCGNRGEIAAEADTAYGSRGGKGKKGKPG